jgi:hypothetical protein
MDTLGTATNETQKYDCVDYDPPYFEYVTKAKIEDVVECIKLIVVEEKGSILSTNTMIGNSVKYYDLRPYPLKDNKCTIFIYECLEDAAGKVEREPLGHVIEFSFLSIVTDYKLKVSATCYLEIDNSFIVEYFKDLWNRLVNYMPPFEAISTGASTAISTDGKQQEEANHKGRYRLTEEDIKSRKQTVKRATKLRRESNNRKLWKQIAEELDIPERTLRYWRHDYRTCGVKTNPDILAIQELL